ncbi:MAG: hypothetical protein E7206_02025 [Clostridium beijerinckii]|nr:hypothetical protein [Clostridium beijerinckii]
MILLDDKRILKVKCLYNNERIISLRDRQEKILIDETRSLISSKSHLFCHARETIINKLVKAANYIPHGYKLLIKDGYRTLSICRDKNCNL